MRSPDYTLNAHFIRLESRWKSARTLAALGWTVATLSLLFLMLGFAIQREWLQGRLAALAWAVFLALAGVIAVVVVLVLIQSASADRRTLAAASENVHPPLLDRLNTLTHLEKTGQKKAIPSYLQRIRLQAAEELRKPVPQPNWWRPAWLALAASALLLAGTIWFYVHWKPWNLLGSTETAGAMPKPETNFELANAGPELAKAVAAWGEVRITEPGRDLKLTKVDVLHLKIEAAASQALAEVGWDHQINGAPLVPHKLPDSPEPEYSASEDFLYLDELNVTDWDVITYSARARTTGGNQYTSEIYFIEIRPFRSDLAKLPGGEGGAAAKSLNEVSELITRQQQVLRETHHFLGSKYTSPETRTQDREKLGQAEEELKNSTDALYAKTATQFENQPIGDILEALATGGEAMRQATGALRDDAVPAARQHEQSALQALIASRKNLQKFISENSEAFGGSGEDDASSGDPLEALTAVTEFRDRQQAARKEVDQLLKAQEKLRDTEETGSDALATQKDLQKRLAATQKEHPDLFRGVTQQAAEAGTAMEKAADALSGSGRREYTQNRAVDRLQDLQQALAQRDPARATEQAFKMKELLDAQTQQMEQAAAGNLSAEQLTKLGQATRTTTGELQKFAEDEPPGFGPELEKSLSVERQAELNRKLEKAAQGSSEGERKEAAGAASGQMKQISDAFASSLPKLPSQSGEKSSSGGEDPLSRALRQMEGLVQRGEAGKLLPPEAEQPLREAALADLKLGMEEQADAPAVAAILAKASEELREGKPVNVEVLKKLLDEIESFRVELSEKKQREELQGEVSHAQAPKISPLYRERVEAYYRKLSED
jgi:hypothetical protein